MESDRPDLGTSRRLSEDTLQLFHVRHNGTGWEYETRTMDGGIGTRWKSYHSVRPDGDSHWHKYRWIPSKPDGARYFYPPGRSLTHAVQAAHGALYIVGGEIGVMSLFDAGIANATCMFGDSAIPETLVADLKALGVGVVYALPDRDQSGMTWAIRLRDTLRTEIDLELFVLALPFPVEPDHGLDANDYWRNFDGSGADFQADIRRLKEWRLPEPEAQGKMWETFSFSDDDSLPSTFVDAIERAFGDMGGYNGDGWSRKPVLCPFHADEHPSAYWSHEKHILKCFSGCQKWYYAMEVGEAFGLRLADFYDDATSVPVAAHVAAITPVTLPYAVATPLRIIEKALRPPLPNGIALTAEQERIAISGRIWLDGYLGWARDASPLTPVNLQEAMALWLLATVSTRRMKVTVGGEDIYPNLYVLIVCRTSLFRKTTAMKLTLKLLQRAGLESLLLPVDVTPEALFDELAGIKPANLDSLPLDEQQGWRQGRSVAAQRSIYKDECSSIFANLRKEYMGGLTELLLQGYDGDAGKQVKLLKSRGQITVRDVCLSFLGATTPVEFRRYIGDEERENGFIARFAVVAPEGIPEYRFVNDVADIPFPLVVRLRHLFLDVLPWHDGQKPGGSSHDGTVRTPPVMTVQIDKGAFAQLHAYRRAIGYDMLRDETVEEGKAAAYTRLGTMAFKVAMLLAAIDSEEMPVRIEARHAYAAQEICERWRESLYRLERDVARIGGILEDKVYLYLKQAGATGASLTDIRRDHATRRDGEIERALNSLGEEGRVEKFDADPERKGRGRKPWRYRVTT